MLLKVDQAFYLHKKECDIVTGYDRYKDGYGPDCSCAQPKMVVHAKETVCLLSKSNGVTFLVATNGQVGGVRIPWYKIYIWRLNTVQVKEIKHWNGEDISVAFFLLALFIVGCIGVFCLFKTATASGVVDSCVVKEYEKSNEHTGPLYILEGHRSWRSDENLLVTKSREEAETKRLEICPR